MKNSTTVGEVPEVQSTDLSHTPGVHWVAQLTDLDFDSEGRIIIRNPELAAQIKEDVNKGRHILVLAANSGDYCVKVSNQNCFVRSA